MSHLIIKSLVLFWEHDSDLVYEIDRIRDLCIESHLYRIIACYFAFDDAHSSFYLVYIRLFAKRNTIGIVIKSPTRDILHSLCIDESIRYEYNFSIDIRNLGIVERDLLNESLIGDTRLDMESDDLTDLKSSR